MSDGDSDFLSRWSRRKLASKAGPVRPTADAIPASAGIQSPPPAPTAAPAGEAQPSAPLPPVESLTPESDFTPFMKSEVDPALRRQALRTLFRDPRFNVMDGLDVYIDDYSKPDPIPPEWLGKLAAMARLGDCHPPDEDAKPADAAPEALPPGEKIPEEQKVVEADSEVVSDTSAAGSPPPELKQS